MNTSERGESRHCGAAVAAKSLETGRPACLASDPLEPTGSEAKCVSGTTHRGCTDKGHRLYFLDNLRTFAIFLVVLCHVGGVYESSGLWASFWIVDDPSTNNMSGLVNIVLDICMMPTIFFISGYLAPASLERKTAGAFLKAKFTRLMVPWIVAALILLPLYKVIFLFSRGLPQEHWTTYFHWSNGIWNQNWLWFLPVLFSFNLVYLLLSKTRIRMPAISLKVAVPGVFLLGFAYSLGMDLLGLGGWTKTALLDFQNERLLIYFMAFLLGTLFFQRKAFDAKPKGRVLYHVINSIAWIPVTAYIIFLLYPWFKPGQFIVSEIVHKTILWLSFHLSLLCLMYMMIETFRRYLNKSGRLSSELNANSYGVYVIHVIIMGCLALLLLDTAIPSLAKYAILTVFTYGVSNAIICLYRGVRRSKRLNRGMEERIMRTATTAMLLVMLLIVVGCGKREGLDKQGKAPRVSLHVAAFQGNLDAIRQHINAGSDLNTKDAYGSTPLIVATTFGKTETARALIDAGADLQITNNEGSPPLHVAAFLCRTEIVTSLLDGGADKSALNSAGRTALESVSGPFDAVKGIYDGLAATLEPLGLRLDYERIKRTRPQIAEMLR